MSIRIPTLLLVSTAIVSAYLIFLIGDFVPRFFEVAYRETPKEAMNLMPTPTFLASRHSWVFALTILSLSFATLARLKLQPNRAVPICTIGLCSQGAIFWLAMFCFCYEGFCGPMTLHHASEFNPVEFVRFELGVFPISLIALLAPVIAVWKNSSN